MSADPRDVADDGFRRDYYYRAGQELRPGPSYAVVTPAWTHVRQCLFSPWMAVEETPAPTPIGRLAADHMWQGDELMDAVVQWFGVVGARRGRQQLDRALDEGIDALDDPAPALVALFEQLDNPPDWYDAATFERGRQLWVNASIVAKAGERLLNEAITALGSEVSAATGATGRISRDPVRRAKETQAWFHGVTLPGAMDRHSAMFKDTVRVRLMHSQVRRGLKRRQDEAGFAKSGNPISSAGMALGAASFGLTPLLIDHAYGRRCTRSDLDAVAVYWGYIVHVFGVADELIPKNASESMSLADSMLATIGPPSDWSANIVVAVDDLQRTLVLQSDSRALNTVLKASVLPLISGLFAVLMGESLTREMTRGTPLEGMNIGRWSRLARLLAIANVTGARVRDALPDPARRMQARAAAGDPFHILVSRLTNRMAAKHAAIIVNYKSHDNSTTGNFACGVPEPT